MKAEENYTIEERELIYHYCGKNANMKNVYYGFVGMDQSMENIPTFHIKSIYEIIKATGNSCFEK